MPSASSIVLADGQATPANHTFQPQSVTPERTVLVDRDSETSAGQKEIIVGFVPAKGQRKTTRVSLRFNMPVEATDSDGITRVAYTARLDSNLIIPDEATQAERDDFAAFVKNAFADVVLNGYVSNLDPMY